MSVLAIIVTASLAQNVILVHYLGAWPLPAIVGSPKRAAVFSGAITVALLWVSILYWAVHEWIITPLNLHVLETLSLTLIIGLSTVGAMRLGAQIAPFHRKRIRQAVPVAMINVTVFVASMGLVHAIGDFPLVLLGAAAAGAGLFLALVPIAAVRAHFETAKVSPLLRGDVPVYLAAALMALAIQQVDQLLHRFFVPLY